MESTLDYVPVYRWWQWLKVFAFCALTVIVLLGTGVVVGRYAYPYEVFIEKEKIVHVLAKPDSLEKQLPLQKNFEEEVRRATKDELQFILENCVGILEVKDNEAQTVRYKKAAIASKDGFSDLKKGVPYIVHSYFLHKEVGYGLVSDDQRTLFLLKWYAGSTKAPTINPAKIIISAGRRIEILGKPK